jgi:hypothetical protein
MLFPAYFRKIRICTVLTFTAVLYLYRSTVRLQTASRQIRGKKGRNREHATGRDQKKPVLHDLQLDPEPDYFSL